jgi:aspartate 1-decarboxylase
MKSKFVNLLVAALLVLGVLMITLPVSAHSDGSELNGVISAVNTGANTLTVTPKGGGSDVTLNVGSSTIITRFHHSATLAGLLVGDRVSAQYDPSTMLASRIDAGLNLVKLEGLVTAVDTGANTLSVTPKPGGTAVVLKIDANTIIKRNGQPTTLPAIQLGDWVKAQYNPITLLASKISAQFYLVELTGTVTAIHTGAPQTLTVTPKHGGTPVVLNVDTTTLIKRNGQPAVFTDIQLGDLVDAKYNAVTMLAARISAKLNLSDVQGLITAIDTTANTVTVTPGFPFPFRTAATPIVLKVDSTTIIKRNGAAASLAALQVGDRVQAKYNPVTLLAAKIEAWTNLAEVHGFISAVDTIGNTITINPVFPVPFKASSLSLVLKVDTSTVIKRNGATASLAALQVGDRVEAKYNPVSKLATEIDAWANLAKVEGFISAVDTTANTVSITPGISFHPETVTPSIVLKVDSTTVIKRNGAAASLAAWQVGDRVEASYNSGSMLAAEIDAWANLAEVHGFISAVDTTANTVTITPGLLFHPLTFTPSIILKVDSSTVIKRNGAAATLADLQVGDQVDAKYNSVSKLAAEIDATQKTAI